MSIQCTSIKLFSFPSKNNKDQWRIEEMECSCSCNNNCLCLLFYVFFFELISLKSTKPTITLLQSVHFLGTEENKMVFNFRRLLLFFFTPWNISCNISSRNMSIYVVFLPFQFPFPFLFYWWLNVVTSPRPTEVK